MNREQLGKVIQDLEIIPELMSNSDSLPTSRLVIKLKTNSYIRKRGAIKIGFNITKEMYILKNKSFNYDWFFDILEDSIGLNESLIINLNNYEDGIYQIMPCNFKTDGDGNIDDYDFKLMPYNENK